MTLPEAIGQYLRTEATATIAAVGTRTYWVLGPVNATLPYIQFRLASTRRLALTIGPPGAGAPRESSIEIVCSAESQSAAWEVAEAVKTDLDGFAGIAPSTGTVRIKRAYVSDEFDLVSAERAESGVFGVALTLIVTT